MRHNSRHDRIIARVQTLLGSVVMQAIATGQLADEAAGRQAIAASFERSTYIPHGGEAWDAAYEQLLSDLI